MSNQVKQTAALLDRNNKVIAQVFDAPEKGNEIQIAGAFTIDGSPCNVSTFKISRSAKNLEKARYEEAVYKKGDFWTF